MKYIPSEVLKAKLKEFHIDNYLEILASKEIFSKVFPSNTIAVFVDYIKLNIQNGVEGLFVEYEYSYVTNDGLITIESHTILLDKLFKKTPKANDIGMIEFYNDFYNDSTNNQHIAIVGKPQSAFNYKNVKDLVKISSPFVLSIINNNSSSGKQYQTSYEYADYYVRHNPDLFYKQVRVKNKHIVLNKDINYLESANKNKAKAILERFNATNLDFLYTSKGFKKEILKKESIGLPYYIKEVSTPKGLEIITISPFQICRTIGAVNIPDLNINEMNILDSKVNISKFMIQLHYLTCSNSNLSPKEFIKLYQRVYDFRIKM